MKSLFDEIYAQTKTMVADVCELSEGKVADDKDSEAEKIKKLTEEAEEKKVCICKGKGCEKCKCEPKDKEEAKEGKVADDRDSEGEKIKKLTEDANYPKEELHKHSEWARYRKEDLQTILGYLKNLSPYLHLSKGYQQLIEDLTEWITMKEQAPQQAAPPQVTPPPAVETEKAPAPTEKEVA